MSEQTTRPPIDGDDERLLALVRGELTGAALDQLLDDAERDPAVAKRLGDWQTLAGLAIDEHVEATRQSAFATFRARLDAAEAGQARVGIAEDASEAMRSAGARAQTETSEPGEARRDRAMGEGLRAARPSWLDRLKDAWREWFPGGPGGLRMAVLVLVLAQAGAIGWMLHDRRVVENGAAVIYRGGGNPCAQAAVSLARGATVDELMQWLGLHGATMNGPDENGRFTIVASDPGALRALLADPDAQRLVAARQPAPAACEAAH